jgi:predicted CopG family antitoxin
MKSVADELRALKREADASRSFADLVREALSLGERDVRLLASVRRISLEDARRAIGRQRQQGRLRSASHESLFE